MRAAGAGLALFPGRDRSACAPFGIRWHNLAMLNGGRMVGREGYQDELARLGRVERVMRRGARVATLGRGDHAFVPEVPECHAG